MRRRAWTVVGAGLGLAATALSGSWRLGSADRAEPAAASASFREWSALTATRLADLLVVSATGAIDLAEPTRPALNRFVDAVLVLHEVGERVDPKAADVLLAAFDRGTGTFRVAGTARLDALSAGRALAAVRASRPSTDRTVESVVVGMAERRLTTGLRRIASLPADTRRAAEALLLTDARLVKQAGRSVDVPVDVFTRHVCGGIPRDETIATYLRVVDLDEAATALGVRACPRNTSAGERLVQRRLGRGAPATPDTLLLVEAASRDSRLSPTGRRRVLEAVEHFVARPELTRQDPVVVRMLVEATRHAGGQARLGPDVVKAMRLTVEWKGGWAAPTRSDVVATARALRLLRALEPARYDRIARRLNPAALPSAEARVVLSEFTRVGPSSADVLQALGSVSADDPAARLRIGALAHALSRVKAPCEPDVTQRLHALHATAFGAAGVERDPVALTPMARVAGRLAECGALDDTSRQRWRQVIAVTRNRVGGDFAAFVSAALRHQMACALRPAGLEDARQVGGEVRHAGERLVDAPDAGHALFSLSSDRPYYPVAVGTLVYDSVMGTCVA